MYECKNSMHSLFCSQDWFKTMETKRTYRIETIPITVERDIDGGSVTHMGSLNFRVVDVYTDMPIGSVLHVKDGQGPIAYHAFSHFFKSEKGDNSLKPPGGGWGTRFDLAAKALWKDYSRRLPRHVRAVRWMWRWQPQGWAFAMLALGAFLTHIFESGTNSDQSMYTPVQATETRAPMPTRSAHSEPTTARAVRNAGPQIRVQPTLSRVDCSP